LLDLLDVKKPLNLFRIVHCRTLWLMLRTTTQ